jgi:RNA polymerase sigma-70 factor (ECF subfamily)
VKVWLEFSAKALNSRVVKALGKLEQEVGARLQAGDIEGAAARVLEICGPGVRGYLRVAVTGALRVRDAYSIFSEAVWQSLRRYRGEPRLSVWAYRLAYAAAKQQRDQTRPKRTILQRKGSSNGARALSRTRAATIEPLGAAEDAELMRAELSLEEQTLLTLRIDRGFSWQEIGCVLGRANAAEATRRRYERLVQRLHRAAIARGFIEPQPLPAKLESLQLSGRSVTRDA